MYDVRTDMPWHFEPYQPYMDLLNRVADAEPELLEQLEEDDYPPPYPGARSILHWTSTMVTHMPIPIHLSYKSFRQPGSSAICIYHLPATLLLKTLEVALSERHRHSRGHDKT